MKICTLRMPEDLWNKAKELADSYKLTRSDFIRYLICTSPEADTVIQIAKKDIDVFVPFCNVFDMCTAYDLTKHYPDDVFRFHLIDDSLGERVYFIKNGKHI